MNSKSLPKRPYLLRAYYDWLVDSDLTPYLVVDATYKGVKVPIEYVQDGQIVLNLSSSATGNLELANDVIKFNARFRGIPQEVIIPMGAAIAIYARENGDGIMFEVEEAYDHMDAIQENQPLSFIEATDNQNTKENGINKKTNSPPKLRFID